LVLGFAVILKQEDIEAYEERYKKKLVILGSGIYGMVVNDTAKKTGIFDDIVFINENFACVIPMCRKFIEYNNVYIHIFPAFVNKYIRLYWLNTIKNEGFLIPNIVHPSAKISSSAKICEGCFIGKKTVIGSNVVIERGSIVSANVLIEHDSHIGEFSYISMGVVLKFGSHVGRMTEIRPGKTFPNTYPYYFEVGV